MEPAILVVDDDKNLVKVVKFNLEEEGYAVLTAGSAEEAVSLIEENYIDLVLTDVRMPGMGGMELLNIIHERWPQMPVILITAFAQIDSAVEAIKAGAVDYIPKPFNRDDLKFKVKKALEHIKLKKENSRLKGDLARQEGFQGIIGRSTAMKEVFDLVTQVSASDATVLITGASGTGKELVARAIHNLSERSEGPWLTINCAAIPRDLLESDLFGHIKGAFTGAVKDHAGKFEAADHGTVFLDEIGDIDVSLQPKLLRVLQEHEIQRVGDTRTIKVDVRVIVATNADLRGKVEDGSFREDLFYRLNVIPINLPPLTKRKDDIVLLADYFLKKYAGKKLAWSKKTLEALNDYRWPGNVRELENLIERLTVLKKGKGKIIEVNDLPLEVKTIDETPNLNVHAKTLPEAEKEMVIKAIEQAGGNRSLAARNLGIPRHVLLYRLKKYNIDI
jgi:two-component system, NtrC family, response regulator